MTIVFFNAVLIAFIVAAWLLSRTTTAAWEEAVLAASIMAASLVVHQSLPVVVRIVSCVGFLVALYRHRKTREVLPIGANSAGAMISLLAHLYFGA